MASERLDSSTGEVVEVLQRLIRNECVNTGAADSGHEHRNAAVIEALVDLPGVELQRFEPAPGRTSLVARLQGSDPTAPSLCLMGHTDVVPVTASGWRHDPFGGELVTGDDGQVEIWGRGAVDMLNLTASMAVTFRRLAQAKGRPRGDLVMFAVADEEAGSAYGARWIADHHPAAITTDFAITESGGLHRHPEGRPPVISINIAEKGVAWRRLRIVGTPGHGSRPYRADNALVVAAAVIQRITDYRTAPRFHELWRPVVEELPLDAEQRALLLDEDRIDQLLAELPNPALAGHLHACTHTTLSPNALVAGAGSEMKTNVIPDVIDLDIDIRTLPGEGPAEVEEHLRRALGDDLMARVEITELINDPASMSRTDTALWDALRRAISVPFPEARLQPDFMVGFTDARVLRDLGSTVYGAALFSPALDPADYGRRFHGHDERVDTESLRLTTELYERVALDLLY